MIEVGLSVVAGLVSIVALVLRAKLTSAKTKGDEIAEAARLMERRLERLGEKISAGRVNDVITEMDSLVRANRLLRLLAEGRPASRS